jgi:small-conductance mechanosensitive channel
VVGVSSGLVETSPLTTLLLALVLAAADAAPAAAEPAPPAELVFANRPIVTLRATAFGITPQSRATGTVARLREITSKGTGGEVEAKPIDEGYLITVGGVGAFRLLREDLDPLGEDTLEAVRDRTVANLRTALGEVEEARSLPRLLRGAAVAAIATAVLLVFLFLLRRLAAWVRPRLEAASLRGMARAGSAEFAEQAVEHLRGVLRGLVVAAGWTAAIVAVYVWLLTVLGAFPYTRAWSEALGGRLYDILRGLTIAGGRALPGLLTVAVIFFASRWLARLVHRVFDAIESGAIAPPGLYPDTIPATRRIVTVLLWLFALALAYPFLPGAQSTAFQGVTVFAGLMITIGSGAFVGHLLAGYMIIYSRTFRVGDYVRIGDTEGTIQSIGMFTTKIETLRREVLSIPNSVVFSGSVTNYSLADPATGIIVQATVTIGYREPWRQVEALLLQAAAATEGVRKEPRPFVRQRELSSFYVEYVLFAFIELPEKRLAVLSALHAAIQDAFNASAVQIMAPHYEADPERPVIAPKSRWNP